MLKKECQEANIVGVEYTDKYDGVWDWCCVITDKKICRWELDNKGNRVKLDNLAIDNLCEDCEHLH
jgi:hypothetical protein